MRWQPTHGSLRVRTRFPSPLPRRERGSYEPFSPREKGWDEGRGFTLIEVLVVIVILGISVGLITVNLARDSGEKLEDDARRLALLLQYARDDAIVSGHPVALTAGPEGHVFSRREPGRGWVPYLDNSTRTAVAVPAQSRLRVAGVDVPAGEPLVFSPSGMALPYELTLAADEWRVTMTGDHSGSVSVTRAFRGGVIR